MITPAFSPTATERVLPRLALDFTTGVLDSRVTVTRALNTATRVNSSGLIEGVNANLPRFDYDPSTLAPKGLLIEGQRANLFTYSQDFSNAAWDSDSLTKTSGLPGGLDGTASVGEFSKASAGGTFYPRNSATNMAANTTYTISMWLWHVGAPPTNVRFAYYAGSWQTSPNLAVTTTPTRFTWTVTTGATAPSFGTGLYLDFGAAAGAIRVWGAQLEAGAFATSYIPTTTTSLTRNADAVSMTGTNFSSWYNQPGGAFAVKFTPNLTVYNGMRLLAVRNAGLDRVIDIYSYLGTDWFSFNGTTNVVAGSATVTILPQTITAAYAAGSYAACLNGGTVGTAASPTLNTPTRMDIGNLDGGNYFNGYIQEILYWPQRITNAETRAFSK